VHDKACMRHPAGCVAWGEKSKSPIKRRHVPRTPELT
jgi:hypothetical protein